MNIQTTIQLNNGIQMPLLGLGVFLSEEGEQTYNAVRWALDAGYCLIDTAAVYGNERSVGRAIRDSGVKRNSIFLTTKLWNEDMRRGTQLQAFARSLELLQTDYVDLYLTHWPVPGKYVESWQVLEQIYKNGSARAIGVSNHHEHHLHDVLAASDIVPAVNQIEIHPRLTQEPLVAFCRQHGIAAQAWSPLGGSKAPMVNDETLSAIGRQYGKTGAQVILRWNLQRGLLTIPKSVNRKRIEENAQLFDFALSDADMAAISAMNRDQRVGADPDNFPF